MITYLDIVSQQKKFEENFEKKCWLSKDVKKVLINLFKTYLRYKWKSITCEKYKKIKKLKVKVNKLEAKH